MWNFFQQPWTLLIVAAILLWGVYIFRAAAPGRCRWFYWLIPVVVAVLGLGLDYFFHTDRELIRETLLSAAEAVQNRNCDEMAQYISEDYKDTFHRSKKWLISHCNSFCGSSPVQEIIIRNVNLETTPFAQFTARVVFSETSSVARNYKNFALVKTVVKCKKENGQWLIENIEIVEIDLQSVNWKTISQKYY